jgi:hypothetical protein
MPYLVLAPFNNILSDSIQIQLDTTHPDPQDSESAYPSLQSEEGL